jgi:hypothetical protein
MTIAAAGCSEGLILRIVAVVLFAVAGVIALRARRRAASYWSRPRRADLADV